MSIKVMASVWEHSKQQGTALLMMLAIADNANEYGEAWPGVKSLADKCRMKERQAQRLIHKLEEAGELKIAIQQGAETPTGKTNMYTVITPGALSRIGVSSSTPLSKGVSSSTPVGVSSESARGVIQGQQGVSSSTPKPSVKPLRTLSGGVNRENAAAAVDQEVVAELQRRTGLNRNQAITYASLHSFSASELNQLSEWTKAKRLQKKNPAAILAKDYVQHGDLPDDLPPPPEPIELPIFDDNGRVQNHAAWEREYGPGVKHLYHKA